MKQTLLKKFFIHSLAALLVAASLPAFAGAQKTSDLKKQTAAAPSQPLKLAPDLEELLAFDDEVAKEKKSGAKTLRDKRAEKLARRTVVGNLVLPSESVGAEEKQSFIVQMSETATASALKARLAGIGGTVRQSYNGMGLVTIEAPRKAIRQIVASGDIAYITPDREVTASGHLENTTGAAQIRSVMNNGTALDGRGIGIAVIDSGIHNLHDLIINYNGHPGVALNQSFRTVSDEWQWMDVYGHGSHVASLIVGNSAFYNGAYTGIAPNATLYNLRVLENDGRGAASSLIAALNWCVTNKAAYNLRVINLSLGANARDSYLNDPVCQAARRAVNAGIVVVAAAGNNGKDSSGRKIYGAIHSPGIDPSVITVGASNTLGTDARSDDVITSYSSRGPTRGYRTVNGVRKYDNLIKPDLVAPGNKLIAGFTNVTRCVASPYTSNTDLVPTSPICVAPELIVRPQTTGYNGLMSLSGTSMAAPVVTGAVALMLQANPSLTPNLVKAILMYTAQPLANFNMLEQGAGQLNVDGAVRMARLVKTTLPTTNGSSLLNAALPTLQTSTIAGQSIGWGQAVITNYGFLYGSPLMQYWQTVYGNGVVLADATAISGSSLVRVSGRTSSGVYLKTGAVKITTSGALLSSGVVVADGVMLADGVILADGVVIADGVVVADGVILADGTTRADTAIKNTNAYRGDNTPSMQPVP